MYCFVLYCIVSYRIVLYCIVLYCIVLYCIVLPCICIVLYRIILYYTVLVLHCIVLYLFYCIALYCIVLHCIVLYCIVLYYIILHCLRKQYQTMSVIQTRSKTSLPTSREYRRSRFDAGVARSWIMWWELFFQRFIRLQQKMSKSSDSRESSSFEKCNQLDYKLVVGNAYASEKTLAQWGLAEQQLTIQMTNVLDGFHQLLLDTTLVLRVRLYCFHGSIARPSPRGPS